MGLRLGEMTTVVLLACAIGNVERRCEIFFARMRGRKRRSHMFEIGRPGRNSRQSGRHRHMAELADTCASSCVSWLSRTARKAQGQATVDLYRAG